LWWFQMANVFRAIGLSVLLLGLTLSGCRAPVATPSVVVSIKPIHALVAGVMEGVEEPGLLMDGMASPHTYQMRPSDARQLARADLVIWVGPGVEGTFPETLDMLPAAVITMQLEETPGLSLLPVRTGSLHLEADDPQTPHVEAQHVDGQHEGMDPHIWLDPLNAVVLTNAFVAQLSALDPENAGIYRQNGDAQIARLRALDAELRETLAPISSVPFMTFHDAFQYFEAAYGLNGVASIAISPERMPGARTVTALRREIQEQGVVCVFTEPQFEPQLLQTVLEGSGAWAGTLDPLGENIAPGPRAYEAILRQLAHNMVADLGSPHSSEGSTSP
jgi:zinc transport system substrate-binding protein